MSGRARFPVVANASLSLVLQAVQEDRVLRPVPSGEMHLRRELSVCVLLQRLRRLEYVANLELALQRLFVEGNYHRCRVPVWHAVVEVAQSSGLDTPSSCSG
jgi:hypothetical protein